MEALHFRPELERGLQISAVSLHNFLREIVLTLHDVMGSKLMDVPAEFF